METKLENILMSRHKEAMISFMNAHPEYFEEAIDLAISDKETFSWRAAWLLWSCMELNDQRIQSYVKTIIKSITTKNDGHQRELIKILLQMNLSEEQEGILFNTCMNIWERIDKMPSVRFTAFQFIVQTGKKYPELTEEIIFLTQNHYLESLSPGIKRSVQRLIKEVTM